MASVERHGKTWRVVWREDGEKHWDKFATEAEAKSYKVLVEHNGNQRPAAADLDQTRRFTAEQPILFEEFAWDWFAGKSGPQAYDMHRIKRDIERYLIPAFGGKILQNLSPQDDGRWIKDLQDGRYGQRLAPSTIAKKHGLMAEIMNAAVWYYPNSLIPRSPFASQGKSKARRLPKIQQTKMTFLLHEEFWALHDAAAPWAKPIYLTMVTTGIRFSELAGLPVRNVDLDARTLRVSQSLHHGEKNDTRPDQLEYYWHIGPPKSESGYRTLSLDGQTCAALTPLMANRKPDDLIFSAPGRTGTGGRVSADHRPAHFTRPVVDGRTMDFEIPVNFLQENILWRNLKGAKGRTGLLEKLGISQRFRIHDLRHTHVSWCANATPRVELEVISERLGHSSITITVDRYHHLYPGRDRAAAAAMDAALARPTVGDNVVSIRRTQV